MFDRPNDAGWWNTISRRVREREAHRLGLHNRIRKAITNPGSIGQFLGERVSATAAEFFKMLGGSLLGFWVIASALRLLHAKPIYTFASLGLVYCLQTSYYAYRLFRDPAYKIPKCKCAGRRNDGTEAVLRSRQSSLFRIPNSATGALLYTALLFSIGFHNSGVTAVLAAVALAASVYFSYVMIARIGSVCVNCVNIAALNLLILVYAQWR